MRAKVVILIYKKKHFKKKQLLQETKKGITDNEKESNLQDVMMIINTHAPNIRAFKHMK